MLRGRGRSKFSYDGSAQEYLSQAFETRTAGW